MRLPSPETLLVGRIDWDLFATFTHAPLDHVNCMVKTDGRMSVVRTGTWWDQLPHDEQWARLWRWQKETIKVFSLRRREFVACYRWEVGKGGREHFHGLFKILNRSKVTKASRHIICHVWSGLLGFGHANCRRSNSGAADYITKTLSSHEEERFTGSTSYRSVLFNDAAIKYLS